MKIQLTHKEIIQKFNLPENCEVEVVSQDTMTGSVKLSLPKTITLTFPQKTAKEIMDECDNKVDGGKLLYSTDWYKKEPFFTTEKTRPGTRTITTELRHADKSWNEITNLVGESNMLNFAEVVYCIRESKEFRDMLQSNNDAWWTWTNSRDSDGRLVGVGNFDGEGVAVSRGSPDRRYDALGVSFSPQ